MSLFTIPQAARFLGKTRQDIWYLVKRNKINSTKIGSIYVIKEEDLRQYIYNKMSKSSSDKLNN